MATKISEFREMTADELQEKVLALKKELMQLRFQQKTGKLERQSSLREAKRKIARMLTVINESKRNEKKS